MTGELKPCPNPWCDSDFAPEVTELLFSRGLYRAQCACGQQGPAEWGPEAARTAWNTRPREEALEAEVGRLREALRPFASLGAALPEHYPPSKDSRFHGPGHPRFWYEIDPVHIWNAQSAVWPTQNALANEPSAALSHPKGADDER